MWKLIILYNICQEDSWILLETRLESIFVLLIVWRTHRQFLVFLPQYPWDDEAIFSNISYTSVHYTSFQPKILKVLHQTKASSNGEVLILATTFWKWKDSNWLNRKIKIWLTLSIGQLWFEIRPASPSPEPLFAVSFWVPS